MASKQNFDRFFLRILDRWMVSIPTSRVAIHHLMTEQWSAGDTSSGMVVLPVTRVWVDLGTVRINVIGLRYPCRPRRLPHDSATAPGSSSHTHADLTGGDSLRGGGLVLRGSSSLPGQPKRRDDPKCLRIISLRGHSITLGLTNFERHIRSSSSNLTLSHLYEILENFPGEYSLCDPRNHL